MRGGALRLVGYEGGSKLIVRLAGSGSIERSSVGQRHDELLGEPTLDVCARAEDELADRQPDELSPVFQLFER